MESINKYLGKFRVNICARCGEQRPPEEINHEATIHHNAARAECIDRKACQRRVRARIRAEARKANAGKNRRF